MTRQPVLDHPTLAVIKKAFPDGGFKASEFRGMTTLVVTPEKYHEVARYLRDAPECDYDFLSDVVGVDYLGYPVKQIGRFSVSLLLASGRHNDRFVLKTFVDPSVDTSGIDFDPTSPLARFRTLAK